MMSDSEILNIFLKLLSNEIIVTCNVLIITLYLCFDYAHIIDIYLLFQGLGVVILTLFKILK